MNALKAWIIIAMLLVAILLLALTVGCSITQTVKINSASHDCPGEDGRAEGIVLGNTVECTENAKRKDHNVGSDDEER